MYHYLYHHELKRPKYDKLVLGIESRLHSLGLEGKKTRLSSYSNLKESIEKSIDEDVKTLVVVGDDELLSQTITMVAPLDDQPVLGYLPVFEETNITKNLGLALGEQGIISLAQRLTKPIRLGKAGELLFLDSVKIFDSGVEVSFNGFFKGSLSHHLESIIIYNLSDQELDKKYADQINPQDKRLEVGFMTAQKNILGQTKAKQLDSFFYTDKVILQSLSGRGKSVLIDGFRVVKTPLEVMVSEYQIQFIVGKQRLV